MSKHTVILIRHAQAVDSSSVGDKGRQLSEEGKSQALSLGKQLKESLVEVGAVFVSPATRAEQTWQAVAEGAGLASVLPQAKVDETVYTGSAQSLVDIVRIEGRGDTIVIVGHEPTISEVAHLLAKKDSNIQAAFPVGSALVLTASKDWKEWHSHMTEPGKMILS